MEVLNYHGISKSEELQAEISTDVKNRVFLWTMISSVSEIQIASHKEREMLFQNKPIIQSPILLLSHDEVLKDEVGFSNIYYGAPRISSIVSDHKYTSEEEKVTYMEHARKSEKLLLDLKKLADIVLDLEKDIST